MEWNKRTLKYYITYYFFFFVCASSSSSLFHLHCIFKSFLPFAMPTPTFCDAIPLQLNNECIHNMSRYFYYWNQFEINKQIFAFVLLWYASVSYMLVNLAKTSWCGQPNFLCDYLRLILLLCADVENQIIILNNNFLRLHCSRLTVTIEAVECVQHKADVQWNIGSIEGRFQQFFRNSLNTQQRWRRKYRITATVWRGRE